MSEEMAGAWESAGRLVASALDDVSAALVVGDEVDIVAHAALGIGREQALRRRVAVADLGGETPALQSLVTDDDPHGITDSFLYGVSMNRIARPVGGAGNIFILPSGSEPAVPEEVFRSERWRRLAAGFAEAGALLLVVAPLSAPGIDALAASLERVVLVDDAAADTLGAVDVLATVQPPSHRQSPTESVVVPDEPPAPPRPKRLPRGNPGAAPWLVPVLAGTALLGAIAGVMHQRRAAERTRQAASPAPVAQAIAPPPVTASSSGTIVSVGALLPANPADSSVATAFTIAILHVNTDSAAHDAATVSHALPALAFSPIVFGSDRNTWYRLTAGAFDTRVRADSALAAWQRDGLVSNRASVLRAPYALLLADSVPADSIDARRERFASIGSPVYALVQRDGRARLFTGAFETPEQARPLATLLAAAGITPMLVYRTGRSQ